MSHLFVGKSKAKEYSNNPHTLDKLEHNIWETITYIKIGDLKLVSINLFKGLEV
jgi:hypothetical protein